MTSDDRLEGQSSPAPGWPDNGEDRPTGKRDPWPSGSDRHALQQLIEGSPHAIAVTEGAAHVFRNVNSAFCRMMHTSSGDVLGRGYAEAFPEPAGRGPLGWLDRAFHAGEAVVDQELARPRASSRQEVWSYTVWPRHAASGERAGAVIEVSDRTRTAESRRQLEEMTDQIRAINERLLRSALNEQEWAEKAEAASRAKSDFLAMMSHELRTPLTGILGHTDLLEMESLGPVNERQHDSLERIKHCAWHLLELIEDVLAYARTEAHADEVRTEPVDLCALAREAAAVVKPVAERKGLDLHVSLPEPPLAVETDRMKVRQILLNLLSNAVKFTEAGEVRLEVRKEDGGVHFLVSDTGVGIEPADLERVFEPFVQSEQVTTRRFGGTGLGLPISRALALLLGGDVEVRSAPGRGSTFSVHLPLSSPAPRPAL